MNKTFKKSNYSKNRSKKLLGGSSRDGSSRDGSSRDGSSRDGSGNNATLLQEKKRQEEERRIYEEKQKLKFRPGKSTKIVDSIEKRLNFFSKSEFDFVDIENDVINFYDEIYTSPRYNSSVEKETIYTSFGVHKSRITRWEDKNKIQTFMENNYLNLQNDLNSLSEEEFFDKSYIAFNDLHGCISDYYNIVPSNTILCFIAPIDHTAGFTYDHSFQGELTFLKKMYNLTVPQYKDLFYSRDKIKQNDLCKSNFCNTYYSCFKNAMWFFPGQIYPNLQLSLGYEELDNSSIDGPCFQFQYFDIEETPKEGSPKGTYKVVGKDIHSVANYRTPKFFNSREAYKEMAARSRSEPTYKKGDKFLPNELPGYLSTFVNIRRPDKKFKLVISGNCRVIDPTNLYGFFNLKLELYIYHLNKTYSEKYNAEGTALITTLCHFESHEIYNLLTNNSNSLTKKTQVLDYNLTPYVPLLMEICDKFDNEPSYELTENDIIFIFTLSPKKILLFLNKVHSEYPEKFDKFIEKLNKNEELVGILNKKLLYFFGLGKNNIIKSLASKYITKSEDFFITDVIQCITEMIFEAMENKKTIFIDLLTKIKNFNEHPKNQITFYREINDKDLSVLDIDMNGVKIIIYNPEIITERMYSILNVEDETKAPFEIIFNTTIKINLYETYNHIKVLTFNNGLEFKDVERHQTMSQLFQIFPNLEILNITNYNYGLIKEEFLTNKTIHELKFINFSNIISNSDEIEEDESDYINNTTSSLNYLINNMSELRKATFINCLKVPQNYPYNNVLSTLIIDNITCDEPNIINLNQYSRITTLSISNTENPIILTIQNNLEDLKLDYLSDVKIETILNVKNKLDIRDCDFQANSSKKYIALSTYTFTNLNSFTFSDNYKIKYTKGKEIIQVEFNKIFNLKHFLNLGYLKINDKYIDGKRKKKRIQKLLNSLEPEKVQILEDYVDSD